MVTSKASPLDVVDLMRLYGRIHFTWNLRTDHMVWNGPIHKLFGSENPLSSGSSFLSRLSPSSFWKRFTDIDQREVFTGDEKATAETYTASYVVTLPNQAECHIEEEATLIKSPRGLPDRIEGTIRVTDAFENVKDFSGYDSLTGFPSQEVLYENLACLVEQTKNEDAPGGYLVFCIDKLSLIYFLYGLDAMKEALTKVALTLKKFTRFNDMIGRPSGCSFGITVKDSDEWGVFKAANRLVSTCAKLQIKTPIEKFSPVVSVGGAAFRNGITPLSIIQQAEESLYDMQNMRGTGIMMDEAHNKKIDFERPSDATVGRRRLADDKLAQKGQGSGYANKTG